MRIVKIISPKGTAIELRWDNLDKADQEVAIYQAGVYAGCYSLAVAEAGIAKMIAAGLSVIEAQP